jgi:hypothetical protein
VNAWNASHYFDRMPLLLQFEHESPMRTAEEVVAPIVRAQQLPGRSHGSPWVRALGSRRETHQRQRPTPRPRVKEAMATPSRDASFHRWGRRLLCRMPWGDPDGTVASISGGYGYRGWRRRLHGRGQGFGRRWP